MKKFMNNDKRFYNMTKWQRTFLYIMTKLQKNYKSLAKKLQKLQGCNKYLPLGARPVSAGQVRVYALSGAPCQYIRLKELRLRSWELRLATWGAAFQRELRLYGALPLWELQL
jgi:hypothetical protein